MKWIIPDAHSLGRVAVLMGGRSAEREISIMSGTGVLTALKAKGVDAHAVDPALESLADLRKQGFDRCFICLHGRYGEDGTVQGALELLDLPYTGAGVLASSVAMDKVMTKRIWSAEGLPTPAWRSVDSVAATEAAFEALGSPMIVKPAREGSTIGLSKVENLDDCEAAYCLATQHDNDVLCEQFISGDEVTCPVLGSGKTAVALPIILIRAPNGNYDYENKYFTDDTQYLVPSGLPPDEESRISAMVVRAYQTLGVRAWGRIDVMIDGATRQPYLLEINTAPGMTGHSLVPMSAKAAGLNYGDLCVWLLGQAALDHSNAQEGVNP